MPARKRFMTDSQADSKSRFPAPAPTPVEGWICRGGFYHGKTIERCMECGELQEDARHRIEVAGRSPAEVPPNWNEDKDVQKERERVRLDCRDYAVALIKGDPKQVAGGGAG